MPGAAVYVGYPSRWKNPFILKACSRADAVRMFKDQIGRPDSGLGFDIKDLEELRGKDLSCWCAIGDPCHADVLLEIANSQ